MTGITIKGVHLSLDSLEILIGLLLALIILLILLRMMRLRRQKEQILIAATGIMSQEQSDIDLTSRLGRLIPSLATHGSPTESALSSVDHSETAESGMSGTRSVDSGPTPSPVSATATKPAIAVSGTEAATAYLAGAETSFFASGVETSFLSPGQSTTFLTTGQETAMLGSSLETAPLRDSLDTALLSSGAETTMLSTGHQGLETVFFSGPDTGLLSPTSDTGSLSDEAEGISRLESWGLSSIGTAASDNSGVSHRGSVVGDRNSAALEQNQLIGGAPFDPAILSFNPLVVPVDNAISSLDHKSQSSISSLSQQSSPPTAQLSGSHALSTPPLAPPPPTQWLTPPQSQPGTQWITPAAERHDAAQTAALPPSGVPTNARISPEQLPTRLLNDVQPASVESINAERWETWPTPISPALDRSGTVPQEGDDVSITDGADWLDETAELNLPVALGLVSNEEPAAIHGVSSELVADDEAADSLWTHRLSSLAHNDDGPQGISIVPNDELNIVTPNEEEVSSLRQPEQEIKTIAEKLSAPTSATASSRLSRMGNRTPDVARPAKTPRPIRPLLSSEQPNEPSSARILPPPASSQQQRQPAAKPEPRSVASTQDSRVRPAASAALELPQGGERERTGYTRMLTGSQSALLLDQLQQILDLPGVSRAALVRRDGTPVVGTLQRSQASERTDSPEGESEALLASTLATGIQIVSYAHLGAFHGLTLSGQGGLLVLLEIDPVTLLAILAEPDVRLGSLRRSVRRTTDDLKKSLAS